VGCDYPKKTVRWQSTFRRQTRLLVIKLSPLSHYNTWWRDLCIL